MNIELIEIKDFSSFARVLRKFDHNVDSSAKYGNTNSCFRE